jgi:hypothetical protein
MEVGILRQGDILTKVHILGAIHLSQIQYGATHSNPVERVSWMVPGKPVFGDAMVLSHSCEIAPENKVKLTSIILAPLRDLHSATDKARLEQLIHSNYIDPANPSPSFLKYFYVSGNPALVHENGAVVDFSKCFSVRNKDYEDLAKNKVAQLRVDISAKMALKLALYFHRAGTLSVV